MTGAGVNIVRLEIVSSEGADVWDDIDLAAPHLEQLDAAVRAMKDMGLHVISLPVSWVIRDWAVEVLRRGPCRLHSVPILWLLPGTPEVVRRR